MTLPVARVYIDWDRDGTFTGPPSTNYITNGTFNTDLTGWTTFGGAVASQSGGKLHIHRNNDTGANIYQTFTLRLRVGDQVTVTFKVANPSATDKTYWVVVGDASQYFGELIDVSTISAGATETTRTIVFDLTVARDWGTMTRLEFLILTDDASNDPAFDMTFDDVTFTLTHNKDEIDASDIMNVSAIGGFSSPRDDTRVADIGTCTITLKNDTRDYSPEYTLGPLYGQLLPNLPVKVVIQYGSSSWTLFRGVVRSIVADPDQYGPMRCTISCQDMLGKLEETKISLPLMHGRSADYALRQIGSMVFRTAVATFTVTFTGQPSPGDTVSIGQDDNKGTWVYTFVNTTPAAAYEVLIGSAKEDTAQNLVDAINCAQTTSTTYGPNTIKSARVTAELSGAVITLTSVARGTPGNTLFRQTTSGNISFDFITPGGGIDGPVNLIDYDAGNLEFVLMGHTWREGETNGLTAWTDPIVSEFGLGWCARDGTLTFRNKDWAFTRYVQTPDLTTSDGHNIQDGRTSIDDIFTRATVNYSPTKETASVVVASSEAPIQVPGTMTGGRFNPYQDKGTGNQKVITLQFVNTGSADMIGAKDLVLPMEPGVDFEVYLYKDGSGPELSSYGFVTIAVAPTGSSAELSMTNFSGGEYWLYNVQLRGTRIEQFNPVRITIDDSTTQDDYGRRELSYSLPFSTDDVDNFATSLAQHLLYRNKDARFVITQIGFKGVIEVGGVNVYSLEIGDIIKLSETQTAVSNQSYLILGIQTQLVPDGNPSVTFIVRRIDDVEYWILEDAASELGVNTILGV